MRTWVTGGLVFAMASAWSCCGVASTDDFVRFGEQVNLVIWDKEKGVEHFVRKAQFESKGDDLGFIAPTPSVPELVEVDEQVFAYLYDMKPVPRNSDAVAAKAAGAAGGAVDIIQEKDVAGYRATTLKATDPGKLAEWMKENGYATTPAVEEWTQFYIGKGWYLTAFKVNVEDGRGETGTVRMTFNTDKPFNPYKVPKDNFGSNAGLKLFYIGKGETVGNVGERGKWVSSKWSAPLKSHNNEAISGYLKLGYQDIPSDMTLSYFEDENFPNEASDDLYFREKSGFNQMTFFLVGGAMAVGATVLLRKRSSN